MAFIEVDEHLYPVVTIRIKGSPTPEQYQEHLSFLGNLLETRFEPLVLLFDLSQAQPSADDIKQSSRNWMEKNGSLVERKVQEVIFVHQSPTINRLMSHLFTHKPFPVPNHFSANIDEAYIWVSQQHWRRA